MDSENARKTEILDTPNVYTHKSKICPRYGTGIISLLLGFLYQSRNTEQIGFDTPMFFGDQLLLSLKETEFYVRGTMISAGRF